MLCKYNVAISARNNQPNVSISMVFFNICFLCVPFLIFFDPISCAAGPMLHKEFIIVIIEFDIFVNMANGATK